MFISIVIPIYNVEKYLSKCIESCLNQNIDKSKYEIILIDDGSPDNCPNIADYYAKKYDNITVIHQLNQGLSVARNRGLAIAKGEYIWFVDSDDWIKTDCLNDIILVLNNEKPDFLQIPFYYVWENDKCKKSNRPIWDGVIDGPTAYKKNGIYLAAQFSIVKRAILIDNNLRFYPGILHEDIEYKPKLIALSQKCISYKRPVYYYLQRDSDSITSRFSKKNALGYLTAAVSLTNFIKSYSLNNQQREIIQSVIGTAIIQILINLSKLSDDDLDDIKIQLSRNRYPFWEMRQSKNINHYFIASIFLFSPRLTFWLINLINLFLNKKAE